MLSTLSQPPPPSCIGPSEFKALGGKIPEDPSTSSSESTSAAITRDNWRKNRYPDVLPFDHCRVRLLTSAADYINASFIPGAKGARTYISAQAPLPHTFNDFWLMVWENQCPVITMLTKFIEKRKVKAHCYWPSAIGQTEVFGTVAVTLREVSVQCDGKVTLRAFRLHDPLGSYRDVVHIHYTEWPDCGVPSTTDCFKRVLDLMDHYSKSHRSPSLVHCSAGIGRAGTFIAVHSFISQRLIGTPNLSVPGVVQQMRTCRAGMVQTSDQYQFIFKTISEIVQATSVHC